MITISFGRPGDSLIASESPNLFDHDLLPWNVGSAEPTIKKEEVKRLRQSLYRGDALGSCVGS